MKTNWPIKKLGEIFLFIILITILSLPLAYVVFPNLIKFLPQPSSSFWDSSISNLLATVLALIAGIPVALWVDRFIKRQENLTTYRLSRLKEKEILTLVKEELDFSYNSLFLKGKKGNTKTITIQPLKSDLWDALIASGEAKYIEDPNLLNRISSAYYVLKLIKNIEEQSYIALRTSAIQFTLSDGTKKNAAQMLLEDARTFDTLYEDNTQEALRMIDRRLKGLKKYD